MNMRGDLVLEVLTGEWPLGASCNGRALQWGRERGEFGRFEEVRAFGPWIRSIPCYPRVVEARLLLWGFETLSERGRSWGSSWCWGLPSGIAEAMNNDQMLAVAGGNRAAEMQGETGGFEQKIRVRSTKYGDEMEYEFFLYLYAGWSQLIARSNDAFFHALTHGEHDAAI